MKRWLLLLLVLCWGAAGCAADLAAVSVLEFARSGAEAYTDRRLLYFNEDYDQVTLSGSLELTNGFVEIKIGAPADALPLWQGVFAASTDFEIVLNELTAGTELTLSVTCNGSEEMRLTLRSPVKLVQDLETPERPQRQRQ